MAGKLIFLDLDGCINNRTTMDRFPSFDEFGSIGVFGRRDDFIIRCAKPAQLDVPTDSVVE